jgi:hypothetical protein
MRAIFRYLSQEVVVSRITRFILAVSLFLVLQISSGAAQVRSAADSPGQDIGTLYYLGSFSSARDMVLANGICGAFGLTGRPPVQLSEVNDKALPSFCDTAVNGVVGSRVFGPEDVLSVPYKITTDSKDRIVVADLVGYPSIHIFDFTRRKYSRIAGGPDKRLRSPSGLAIDGHDQLYVTDAQRGAILVYGSNGKFRRYIGNPQGKRLFERPSGIAVDPASGRIFVADTPRNLVAVLNADGHMLSKVGTGTEGGGPGEFAAPTDVVIRDQELFVLDSQNYRIQVFDLAGNFHASIRPETMEPSIGFSVDRAGRIYLIGPQGTVQVFQRDGHLLFRFGSTGSGHGEFIRPTAIWTDRLDRIYVADTGNHRIQSFEWGTKHSAKLPQP